MHDSGCRRNGAEVVECRLRPAQEAVALLIAFKFDIHIIFKCIGCAECINHDGMVNNKINRNERIDLLRISAGLLDGIAHSRQIDYHRDTGEILQHDSRRDKRNFLVAVNAAGPSGQLLHMLFCDCPSVILADSSLQQHFDGKGQGGYVAHTLLFKGIQIIVAVEFAA
ncbi:hypothetical protein D3C75_517620 [compost metagenome]